MINKNKLGLALGIFAAVLHAIWAVAVAIGLAQTYLDWIFPMHFIGNVFQVATFSIINASILVVMAFVGGYVCGWLFAWLWNKLGK
ncbi:hypothetical protein J4463_03420 [Candidatus Pacearchaeota archaeon]|nr:hypothetical protein [Candidatus Pacearchaeota archaeon]